MRSPTTGLLIQIAKDAQPLDKPEYDLPGTIITDDLIKDGTLPFTIPMIANAGPNDSVYLMINGTEAAAPLYIQAADAAQPHRMLADTSRNVFKFSGKARFAYQWYPGDNVNANASTAIELVVLRSDFANPYTDPNGLPPPTVTPSVYKATNLDAQDSLNITIPMDALRQHTEEFIALAAGDSIQVVLELRATTPDKQPQPFFYSVAIDSNTLTTTEIAQTELVITVPHENLAGIDENIGYAYYLLTQGNFERQSKRTPVTIDVVPPHG